jgi:hypothetical protein
VCLCPLAGAKRLDRRFTFPLRTVVFYVTVRSLREVHEARHGMYFIVILYVVRSSEGMEAGGSSH